MAISLKTPRYRNIELQHPVDVFIQLRRPSDGSTSDPRAFQFRPVESGIRLFDKRHRVDFVLFKQVLLAAQRCSANIKSMEDEKDDSTATGAVALLDASTPTTKSLDSYLRDSERRERPTKRKKYSSIQDLVDWPT